MNKKIAVITVVMLCVTVLVVFAGQFLINKILNVMLLGKLTPFLLQYEGGLSRDSFDEASSHPAPWAYKGVSGYHTNKGVTYSTFVALAPKCGYAITPDNFFLMPNDIWLKILKEGYMKPYPLDKISHLPRIQAVIITWAWGSGVSGSETYLARFQREVMGINDSNITPSEIVDNFKKRINPINELEWFNKLCDRRSSDFKKMNTYYKHGKGWETRLNAFRKLFQ